MRSWSWLLLLVACRAEPPDRPEPTDGAPACKSPYANLLVSYTTEDGVSHPDIGESSLGPSDGLTAPIARDVTLTVGFADLGAVIDRFIPSDGGTDGIHRLPEFRIEPPVASNARVVVYAATSLDEFRFTEDLCGKEVVDDLCENELGVNNLSEIDLADSSLSAATYLRFEGLEGETQIDSVMALGVECP